MSSPNTAVNVQNIHPGGYTDYLIAVKPEKKELVKHLHEDQYGPIVRVEFTESSGQALGYDIPYGVLEHFCPSVALSVNTANVRRHSLTHLIVPVDDLDLVGRMVTYLISYKGLVNKTGTIRTFPMAQQEPYLTYYRMIQIAKPLGMVPLIEDLRKRLSGMLYRRGDHGMRTQRI